MVGVEAFELLVRDVVALGGDALEGAAGLALELGVHDRLDALAAHRFVGGAVAGEVLLLVVGLADVAEDVGGERAVGVLAHRALGDADAGHAEVALLELRDRGEVEVGHVMVGEVAIGAEMFLDIFLIERRGEAEGLGDRLDALLDDPHDVDFGPLVAVLAVGQRYFGHGAEVAAGVAMALRIVAAEVVEIEVDVEAGAVFGQGQSVAVADHAAGGGDAGLDGRLLLEAQLCRFGIDDLDVPEAAQEHAHGGKDHEGQGAQAPARRADIFIEHKRGWSWEIRPGNGVRWLRRPVSSRRGGAEDRPGKRRGGRGSGSTGRRR
jgi:hypothetical protein